MKLTPKQREALRARFGGCCAYCGHPLPAKGWHADHVKAVWRKLKWQMTPEGWKMVATGELYAPENDTKENLFPACLACNIDKSNTPLDVWRKMLEERIGVCRRNHSAFRHAERFGLVKVVERPIVFWFERYHLRDKKPPVVRVISTASLCTGEMR